MNPAASLQLALRKRLGDFHLETDLTLPARGVSALFGASGSGKTSLLRLIAGLDRPDHGHIRLGERTLVDVAQGQWIPPHKRRIGIVFQEPRLFPHYRVRGNLTYGMPAHSRSRFDAIVELLGIGALLERLPGTLSGGEAQRVSIGRALLSDPQLLLMDEPLSGLDGARKQELLRFIQSLVRDIHIPIVYISHDPNEIIAIADHLVVIEEGRVLASDALETVLQRLDLTPQLGGFDLASVLAVRVAGHDDSQGRLLVLPPGVNDNGRSPISGPGDAVMPSPPPPLNVEGQLWINTGERHFGGHGRMRLLRYIAERGSISQAAKAMKMSYKAAWDAVDQMNNLAGEPLVERSVGGKGGGATRLTSRGHRLVASFQHLEVLHRHFVDELNRQANSLTDDMAIIRRLSMKSSARNHFSGRVTALTEGAVNDEVELEIFPGQRLVAVITRESSQALGLKVGSEAFALIKASSVIILTEAKDARLSARNRLAGTVERLQPGAVNSEVVLALEGGGHLAAIITHASAENLGLAEGQPASAIFKASSVIVGTYE